MRLPDKVGIGAFRHPPEKAAHAHLKLFPKLLQFLLLLVAEQILYPYH